MTKLAPERATGISTSSEDGLLVVELARRVLGWRPAPGRFIKSGRTWIPSWKFAPLTTVEHAFQLLDGASSTYVLRTGPGGIFEAEVRVGDRVGKASGELKARAITVALARALGLTDPEKADTRASELCHRNRRAIRSEDGI